MKKKLKEKLIELQNKINECYLILLEIIGIIDEHYVIKELDTKTTVKNLKKGLSKLRNIFKTTEYLFNSIGTIEKNINPNTLPQYIDKETDTVYINKATNIKFIFEEE